MKSLSQFPAGISLTHSVVTSLIDAKDPEIVLKALSKKDKKVIKENFDDYMMYIWVHLGDTRFNRHGYRKATDIVIENILRR